MPDTVHVTRLARLVLPLWLGASCPVLAQEAETSGTPTAARPDVRPGDGEPDDTPRPPDAMPERCARAASDVFDQSPDDILVGDVVEDPGSWLVIGQFPPEGPAAQAFICTFGPEGRFRRIDAV